MIDVEYIVDMEELRDNVNGGIVFVGFKKSKIVLDKSIDRWKVVLLDNETTILVMHDKSRLPIGPNEWVVPEDVCRDGRKMRSLVLTSCNATEFSCDDGICIPIQERSVLREYSTLIRLLLLFKGVTETTNATMEATRKNVRHFIGERARLTPTPSSLAQKMMGRSENTDFMVGFSSENIEIF